MECVGTGFHIPSFWLGIFVVAIGVGLGFLLTSRSLIEKVQAFHGMVSQLSPVRRIVLFGIGILFGLLLQVLIRSIF